MYIGDVILLNLYYLSVDFANFTMKISGCKNFRHSKEVLMLHNCNYAMLYYTSFLASLIFIYEYVSRSVVIDIPLFIIICSFTNRGTLNLLLVDNFTLYEQYKK